MKKFINFRPFFILFLICICCIYCFAKLNLSAIYLFVVILPILFFVYLVFKRKFVFLSISFLVIIFVSFYSFFFVKNFSDTTVNNSYFVLSGSVNKINKVNNNFYYLTLDNVVGVDINGNKKTFNGNVSIGINDYNLDFDLEIQDKILCKTFLTATKIFNSMQEINSFYVKNNIKYTSNNLSYSKIVKYDGDQNLLEKLKSYNKNLLISNFGEEVGELAFSILYGDKTFVKDNLIDIFKTSGVIHLFTISGLHVGLIATIIYFILKKLKANDVANFFVCFLFLFVFCLICSFTSSVVRASIMSLTFLFAKLVFRKNDILNSLSFAGVLLLILNPLNIFDAGFQMSFLAIFGLITFGNLFNKIKIKTKILKNISTITLTTLAVQISLLPVLLKIYGNISTWGILANLISIPTFSIFYPILFLVNIVVLILPFFNFLYFLPKSMLFFLIYINSLINLLPFSFIHITSFGLTASVVWFFTQFFVSNYNLTNKKIKIIISLTLTISLVTYVLIVNLQ